MYSTNEKKRFNTWLGSFYTRKWNDVESVIYFEKIFGGRQLLKRFNAESVDKNLIFHSSMVNENLSEQWISSGWKEIAKLNVLSLNLRDIDVSKTVTPNHETFRESSIDNLIDLDKNIFESYWQNSSAAFIETIQSCPENYLFFTNQNDQNVGYAILGVNRKLGYLQRFGIHSDYQNKGLGKELLDKVLKFSKDKKLLNIRLNTQKENIFAQSLYTKNGFQFTKTNYCIFGTSNTK